MINSEHKKFDASIASTPSGTAATITHLSGITQGDSDQNRTGNSLLAKSIYIQGRIVKHASATSTVVRLMLIRDNQQVADTAPTTTEILDPSLGALIDCPLNNETVGRFSVLYSRKFVVNADRSSTFFKVYKKMNSHVRYNGANAGDSQKNHLFWVAISDETTNVPNVHGISRLSYIDN